MIWSKSQLQTYKQCPKRFWYETIARTKEEPNEEIALTRGTDFHHTVEEFYNKIDFGELHRLGVEDKEQLRGFFRSLMPMSSDPVVNDLYDNFSFMETDRWIFTKNNKGVEADRYFKPLYSEVEVVNEKRMIRGKIDWIFLAFDDEYIIGEIKTGKMYEVSEIRKELCFLILLVEGTEVLDKEPKYIMCYYPRDNFVFFEKPKPQSFNALWNMYKKASEGVERRDFHKNISTLCNWCPYADQCLGEEDWLKIDE